MRNWLALGRAGFILSAWSAAGAIACASSDVPRRITRAGATGGTGGAASAEDGTAGGTSADTDGGSTPPPTTSYRIPSVAGGALTQLLAGAPWGWAQYAFEMAADPSDRIYMVYDGNLYRYADGALETYLTVDDLGAAYPYPFHSIDDVDIGSNGEVILLDGGNQILELTGPHSASILYTLSSVWGGQLGVIDRSRMALIGPDGLAIVEPAGATLSNSDTMVRQSGCASEDFALQRSGVFLYAQICSGSLVRGDINGNGAAVLLSLEEGDPNYAPFTDFTCATRAPEGGFYVIANTQHPSNSGGAWPRLLWIPEDGPADGFHEILTTPRLVNAPGAQWGDTFQFCAMAALPSGAIYIQTFDQLWRVAPGG